MCCSSSIGSYLACCLNFQFRRSPPTGRVSTNRAVLHTAPVVGTCLHCLQVHTCTGQRLGQVAPTHSATLRFLLHFCPRILIHHHNPSNRALVATTCRDNIVSQRISWHPSSSNSSSSSNRVDKQSSYFVFPLSLLEVDHGICISIPNTAPPFPSSRALPCQSRDRLDWFCPAVSSPKYTAPHIR